jgi:hypothetical protein
MGIKAGEDTFYQAQRGIVQDGLVLNLDAGVDESYSGGTVWRDLKGSNNGTLTNGPTFDRDKGGSIVFDGSNHYVSFSNLPVNFTSDFSFSASISSSSASTVVAMGHYGSGGSRWWVGFTSDNLKFLINIGNTTYTFQTSYTVNNNRLINAAASVSLNSNVVSFYIDGVLFGSQNTSGSYSNTANSFNIGKYATGFNWPGKIYNTLFFNRALTAAEVLQNFNATRHRFGV